MLKTVATTFSSGTAYGGNQGPQEGTQTWAFPMSVVTTLSGQVTETDTSYCCSFSAAWWGFGGGTETYGKVSDVKVFDYGSGAHGSLLQEKATSYEFQSNNNFLVNNLLNAESADDVYDGNGNHVADTSFSYDESGYLTSSGLGASQNLSSSILTGDRGNVTSTSHWLNGGSNPITHTNWYDDGEPFQLIDAKGVTASTFAYSSSVYWAGLPTSVTDAKSFNVSYGYDSAGIGLTTSVKDENSQVTTYSYDVTGRPTVVSYPDGGGSTTQYADSGSSIGFTVTEKITNGSGSPPNLSKQTQVIVDGLGRLSETILLTDPNGLTYSLTTYDAMGRKYKVWNPTRCSPPTTNCGESTWGITTYGYDAVGRINSQLDSDGTSSQSWSYNGNLVTYTDEAGSQWQRASDALGRLTQVLEPNGASTSPSNVTNYSFDALGNLTYVSQWGGNSYNPSTARNRSFTYDSLSRLTQSYNPETGWICYGTTNLTPPNGSNCAPGYDANGNLVSKTDARGVMTSYSYDALNRLTGKTYSAPSPAPLGYAATSPVTYRYDETFAIYMNGRRTSMTDTAGTESWVYDPMGRIAAITRSILTPQSNQTGSVSFQYNPGGTLNIGTFYTGTGYQYTYDTAGRPTGSAWTGSNPPTPYVSGATYDPSGHLTGLLQGGSNTGTTAVVITSNTYNNRLQPSIMLATGAGGTPVIYSHTLCYSSCYTGAPVGNNGNIQTDTDKNPSPIATVYNYDTLNRLISAQYPGGDEITLPWSESNSYDAFGNLYHKADVYGSNQASFTATPTSQNQLSGIGLAYDAAGNVLTDNMETHYTYDAEERVATAGSWGYSYDGEGKRVLRTSGGTTGSTYWCGAEGTLTDEQSVALSNGSPAQFERMLYLNGQLVARGGFPSTFPHYFILPDQVGSSRVSVNFWWVPSTGQNPPIYTNYFPFGAFVTPPTDTTLEQRFTGKERDQESGNDYFGARYYASSMGRFMSPDWSAQAEPVPYAKLDDPQSLNLYPYVRNNPLARTDPDGHCPECAELEQEAEPYIDDALNVAGGVLSAGFSAATGLGESVARSFAQAGGPSSTNGYPTTFNYQPGANFSPGVKKGAAEAADQTCKICGAKTVPAKKSEKGVTPPANEGQTDHIKPKSKGGTNDPSNAQHTCRSCNRKKSDTETPPAPTPAPPPPPQPPPPPTTPPTGE